MQVEFILKDILITNTIIKAFYFHLINSQAVKSYIVNVNRQTITSESTI